MISIHPYSPGKARDKGAGECVAVTPLQGNQVQNWEGLGVERTSTWIWEDRGRLWEGTTRLCCCYCCTCIEGDCCCYCYCEALVGDEEVSAVGIGGSWSSGDGCTGRLNRSEGAELERGA